jgi:hypothetical protein
MRPKTNRGPAKVRTKPQPRSLAVSLRGLRNGNDLARLMAALISDTLDGAVSSNVGGVVVAAASRLLKVNEMRLKYGEVSGGKRLDLVLVAGEGEPEEKPRPKRKAA